MAAHSAQPEHLARALPKWLRIISLWFKGPERMRALLYAAAVTVLAFITTGFLVIISYAQKHFGTALSEKDVPGFWKAVWEFAVIICVAAPLFSFTTYVESMFVLHWRDFLTRALLAAYFNEHAYFRIQHYEGDIGDALPATAAAYSNHNGGGGSGHTAEGTVDNPDQRICEDVKAFVRSSTAIVISLGKKVLNCAAFAGVLWGVSRELVVFMLLYSVVGTFMTTGMFGKILMQLHYKLLACEADLRFSLVRVREAAESIAFYGGDQAEANVVRRRFAQVVRVAATRIRWSALYDLWTNVYGYATILAPSIITAPRYFAGEIQFGDISQASYAFSSIEEALSIIINNLAEITGLAAETERLDGLLTALEQQQQQGYGQRSKQPYSKGSGKGGRGTGSGSDDEGEGAERELQLQPLLAAPAATVKAKLSDSDSEGVSACLMEQGKRREGLLGRPSRGQGQGEEDWAQAPEDGLIKRVLGSELQGLELQHLSVLLPSSGRPICTHLSLSLQPGESLLIVGPSGCGKSSLLRAMAGLWRRGSGLLAMPDSVFFLPQRPFMPLGNLRHQLLFPSGRCSTSSSRQPSAGDDALATHTSGTPDDALVRLLLTHHQGGGTASRAQAKPRGTAASLGGRDRDGVGRAAVRITASSRTPPAGVAHGGRWDGDAADPDLRPHSGPAADVDDASLVTRLEEVNLGGLAERVGGLDAECDWSHVLSSGEQQRVAVLRLLLHAPHLAFLDEATSAVDHNTEALLYGLIKQRCPCYVSVGHRMQLLRYHTHVLECRTLPGGAEWTVGTSQEYQARLASSTGLTL